MQNTIRMRKRLRGEGHRITHPRKTIIAVLSKTTKHLSAKEIYLKLQKSYPEIGLTTVYRTLDLLVRTGFLNRFDFKEGQSRYELAQGHKEHHHHLICTKCSKIIDYNDFLEDELELVKKTERTLGERFNFDINGHEIQFYGVCSKCR